MKIKILQSIADGIIKKLANASNDEIFDLYFELGIWFDTLCVNYFDLYLD